MTTDLPGRDVHVAFAVDARYLPWCATAALSCADHTPDAQLHVHVLHDGSVGGSGPTTQIDDLLQAHGARTTWHAVDDPRVAALPSRDRFGSVVWLRFLLPEILGGVARVVYLDADTLVTDHLTPLFDVELDGAPIGAVTNVVERSHHARLRALGIEPAAAMNSGVLVMDLERMRKEGTTDALLGTAAHHGQALLWPDQDALNIVLRGRWHRLHPRWNVQNSFWDWRPLANEVVGEAQLDEAIGSPGIVHFEGPSLCKPWHALSVHPWRDKYWQTLRRTPWSHTRPEDLTWVTRALRHLPRGLRIRAYLQVLKWRARHGDTAPGALA